MSIATLVWVLAISGLATGVAGATSAVLRRLGRPERWVWVSALLVTASLPLLPAQVVDADGGADAAPVSTAIAEVMTLAARAMPEPARTSISWIPLLWATCSAATLLALLGGAWSLSRRRERWPRCRVDGDLLRVSDRFGPAVVGWVDPEVVLPEWALRLDTGRRRLILRHENEHRWARDPQLLAVGVLLLAAAPWNPFAWLQFRGLRRGIEFDCDARVLRSGVAPRTYGRLLLSVQIDGGRGALLAPALRDPASFLRQRLRTMTLRNRPTARLRVLGLALVASALTVVACETPRPTEAVDSGAEATAAPTSSIRKVEAEGRFVNEESGRPAADASGVPLIYVDGVRISTEAREGTLDKLPPQSIERIEVVKGEAARIRYGPEAADGVIRIFTKRDTP